MKRGDIYYIHKKDTTGAEIMKGRPGVIVSNNSLNANSEVVEVVFLSTSPKKALPTHVSIYSSGKASTALCEQINTVSKLRVGDKMGACTPEEMAAIDEALLTSLDIVGPKNTRQPTELSKREMCLMEELDKVTAERDRYLKMLDTLLAVIEP